MQEFRKAAPWSLLQLRRVQPLYTLVLRKLSCRFRKHRHQRWDAISELAATISSIGNGRKLIDPGVLQAIYGFSGLIDRQQISEVEWIAPKHGRRKRIVAIVDRSTKDRVAAKLSAPRTAIVHVDGVLDMADFKPGDKKCRIDPALGVSITCTFDPERENQIYDLLRKSVRIVGKAVLRPYTDRIESLHIDELRPLHSLDVGRESFFADLSISDLAQAQNVEPLQNVAVLSGGIPEDEDVDSFLQDIYESRK